MSEAWDTGELTRLSVDLGRGTPALVATARKVVEVAAVKVRKGMAEQAGGLAHAPAFPQSITYDLRGLEAAVGPDKDRQQGALGNILYFGTSTQGPTIADYTAPLRAEAPVVADLLAAAAAKLVL